MNDMQKRASELADQLEEIGVTMPMQAVLPRVQNAIDFLRALAAQPAEPVAQMAEALREWATSIRRFSGSAHERKGGQVKLPPMPLPQYIDTRSPNSYTGLEMRSYAAQCVRVALEEAAHRICQIAKEHDNSKSRDVARTEYAAMLAAAPKEQK